MTDVYYFAMDLAFVSAEPDGDSDDAFDDFTTNVMDELCDLEEADPGIQDPDITAGLLARAMSIYMGVVADSKRDALRLFIANVRTALHAAKCSTPDWPTDVPGDLPEPRELQAA